MMTACGQRSTFPKTCTVRLCQLHVTLRVPSVKSMPLGTTSPLSNTFSDYGTGRSPEARAPWRGTFRRSLGDVGTQWQTTHADAVVEEDDDRPLDK